MWDCFSWFVYERERANSGQNWNNLQSIDVEKKNKCASSELRMDLKTFKDKFTNKIEPFDFKRVIKKKTVETLFGGHVPRSLF